MSKLDNYELRISSIIKKYSEVLFRNPNIVGFGRGFKNRNGELTREPSLIIYVKKKIPICNLHKDKIIPNYFNGVLTDVCEAGEIRFRASKIVSGDIVANINNKDKYSPNMYSLATITCALSEIETQKNIYLLSCNHKLTREEGEYEGKGKLNDKIIYVDSISRQGMVIGSLCDIAPVNYSYNENKTSTSVIDAALVCLGPINDENKKRVEPLMIKNRKIIQGVTLANVGESVYYYGATSGLVKGKVSSVEGWCDVSYKRNDKISKATFEDVICVEMKNDFGDSGALGVVVRGDKHLGFGMLIAGNEKFAYFTPMNTILKFFKLKLLQPYNK